MTSIPAWIKCFAGPYISNSLCSPPEYTPPITLKGITWPTVIYYTLHDHRGCPIWGVKLHFSFHFKYSNMKKNHVSWHKYDILMKIWNCIWPQIIADSDCSHEIERQLLFGRKATANILAYWRKAWTIPTSVSQFFTSVRQSIGASVSASVLSMHIQDWFLLGLTGLISLLWSPWEP